MDVCTHLSEEDFAEVFELFAKHPTAQAITRLCEAGEIKQAHELTKQANQAGMGSWNNPNAVVVDDNTEWVDQLAQWAVDGLKIIGHRKDNKQSVRAFNNMKQADYDYTSGDIFLHADSTCRRFTYSRVYAVFVTGLSRFMDKYTTDHRMTDGLAIFTPVKRSNIVQRASPASEM